MKHQLTQNCQDIITKNYQIPKETFVLLLYDTRSALTNMVAEGYKSAIENFTHQAVEIKDDQDVLGAIKDLPDRSLVILVQSTSFRATKNRLRTDLVRKGHMVIEHARLSYMSEEQIPHYVASLTYDTPYYVRTTNYIESLLNKNTYLRVESKNGLVLEVHSEFEKPCKNTGDFSLKETPSAGFPIGEIFTEAVDLTKLNGKVLVFGFPTTKHRTVFCEPFEVTIKDGCVVEHTGPKEFDDILKLIASEEESKTVQVREIGFGLNKALGFSKRLDEPTAFERFAGIHFSLGGKHAMYRKKFDKKVYLKYHIDIFCKVTTIQIGETVIFEHERYIKPTQTP